MRHLFRLLATTAMVIVLLLFFSTPTSEPAHSTVIAQDDDDAGEKAESVILEGFESYQAFQSTPVWCWAACIEMMANSLKGDRITSQPEIVTRAFGAPVVTAAPSLEFIVGSMKQVWIPNATGYDYRLDGDVAAATDPRMQKAGAFGDLLRTELKAKRAVVLAVNNSHVAVCYGADLKKVKGTTYVLKLYVMDPWPETGKVEVTAAMQNGVQQRDANRNLLWNVDAPDNGGRKGTYFITHVISGSLAETKTVSHPKAVAERLSWLTWGYEQADAMGSVSAFAYFSTANSYKPRSLRARVSWKVTWVKVDNFGRPLIDRFGNLITESAWLPPAENYFNAAVSQPKDQNVYVASLLTTRPVMANGRPYYYYNGLQVYWVLED